MTMALTMTVGAINLRENVGLLGLTRVGSRRVVQISAGFMIFFSTLGISLLSSLAPPARIFLLVRFL